MLENLSSNITFVDKFITILLSFNLPVGEASLIYKFSFAT